MAAIETVEKETEQVQVTRPDLACLRVAQASGGGKSSIVGGCPALAVTLGVTTLASVLLGIIPFFYETIHVQTIRWLAVLLGQ